jgi:hypothetical protein
MRAAFDKVVRPLSRISLVIGSNCSQAYVASDRLARVKSQQVIDEKRIFNGDEYRAWRGIWLIINHRIGVLMFADVICAIYSFNLEKYSESVGGNPMDAFERAYLVATADAVDE